MSANRNETMYSSEIRARQTAFKTFEGVWSALAEYTLSKFLKAVFHKFYMVHS